MKILFSCKECGLVDASVDVQPRFDPDAETVDDWMTKVLRRVFERHGQLSLMCPSLEMSSVKIPVDQTDPDGWIGKELPGVKL